tara:strand:+ start:1308 stop:1754 length:447 start_codon:yes stop_codon:yes gene_type:complete
MTRLTTLDLPTFARATVGFDRMFEELGREFANSKSSGYPPYNVVQDNEDEYTISLAIAGFSMEDLDITLEKNVLTIEGTSPDTPDPLTYLHRGIGNRNFRRQFTLAAHIEVEGADLENGMLHVNLKRNIPEDQKPKKINIRKVGTIEG